MHIQGKLDSGLFVFLFALAGSGAEALAATPNAPMANRAAHSAHTQALPAALRPVFYQALAKDTGASYAIHKDGCALLPGQKLKACFDSSGAHFTGTMPLSLHVVAFGRGNELASITPVQPVIEANEASYAHGNLSEWWRVLPLGFEQGFTIAKRPSGHGDLTLALSVTGQDALASHSRAGGNPVQTSPSIPLRSEGGKEIAWGKLRYGQLVVTDANGKLVPATFGVAQDREQARSYRAGERILIAVNDAHAAYPLTVDPLVWIEQKASASDGQSDDEFGYSVAVDGTTALVGAPDATVNGHATQGAAYVFVFSELLGTWSQVAKLTASDGAPANLFGFAVALDGTTALIGAIYRDGFRGAAYVFSESNGIWSQTAELTASDGTGFNYFGSAVAVSGATALVGAPQCDNNTGTTCSELNPGAAYVFGESNGTWSQTQKLTLGDGAVEDEFGASVAISGATALIGAPQCRVIGCGGIQGAAYVFDESGGTWTQADELIATNPPYNQFGFSVALEGTTALVGAPEIPISGPGAAYVFDESNGNWTQTAELLASDGAASEQFGYSVALDGTTALVGATGHHNDQGAAYVFDESNGNWTQTAELAASDGAAGDAFGFSVALAGTTALVGAPEATVNGNSDQGAAYFEGGSDLGLAVSAPQTVIQGQQYVSQTIATNNASAASPAVSATITVPAAASFISATTTQGSCSEAANLVTCDFASIDGNAGTATANVTLKATGSPGTTIDNTASVALAEPALTASAPTAITATCPAGYTSYTGVLAANVLFRVPAYEAPAGEENAILYAPAGFKLAVRVDKQSGGTWKHIFPGTEVHRWGPAGTYGLGVKANATGGAYTFCVMHP